MLLLEEPSPNAATEKKHKFHRGISNPTVGFQIPPWDFKPHRFLSNPTVQRPHEEDPIETFPK